jgi:hypothetical protein
LFIARTILALVGAGTTTPASFEAKGEIRKQTIQLPIKLSTTILIFFWDGQGTSYLSGEDKMYGLGSVSEAKKKIQGQG